MYGDPIPNCQIKIRQYLCNGQPFGTQPPNLIPANISSYTVHAHTHTYIHTHTHSHTYIRGGTEVSKVIRHIGSINIAIYVTHDKSCAAFLYNAYTCTYSSPMHLACSLPTSYIQHAIFNMIAILYYTTKQERQQACTVSSR